MFSPHWHCSWIFAADLLFAARFNKDAGTIIHPSRTIMPPLPQKFQKVREVEDPHDWSTAQKTRNLVDEIQFWNKGGYRYESAIFLLPLHFADVIPFSAISELTHRHCSVADLLKNEMFLSVYKYALLLFKSVDLLLI